jgi:hypothetical protein
VRSGSGREANKGDGVSSDSVAVADAGANSVCERRCLDGGLVVSSRGGRTTGPGGVALAPSTLGVVIAGADADLDDVEGSNVGSARGDRVSTVGGSPEDSLVSEPVTHERGAFPLASTSRSTMRFARFFRGFALAAERSGDGWCDEEGENGGLLVGLAPLDEDGTTTIATAETPTGTTGGE